MKSRTIAAAWLALALSAGAAAAQPAKSLSAVSYTHLTLPTNREV